MESHSTVHSTMGLHESLRHPVCVELWFCKKNWNNYRVLHPKCTLSTKYIFSGGGYNLSCTPCILNSINILLKILKHLKPILTRIRFVMLKVKGGFDNLFTKTVFNDDLLFVLKAS